MKVWLVILLCCVLWFEAARAASDSDLTKYNFEIPANAYTGAENYTIGWLADRYDACLSYGDHPLLGESIYVAIQAWTTPKEFIFGAYASTQEMPLTNSDNTLTYAERLATGNNWLVTYAEHYLDSIGVSVESLYVHVADDSIYITQQSGGGRGYNVSALSYQKTRWSYQQWNNTSSDPDMYPAGYQWMANGYNADARRAIAYAFVRHFIEDSSSLAHQTGYFSDNQYRSSTAPRLPSYYTINYTTGGSTSGLDWVEQAGIGNNSSGECQTYYDNSTLLIDSVIDYVMDSVCAANGIESVRRFANTDKTSNGNLVHTIQHTSVFFELIYEYPGDAWIKWREKLKNAQTIRDDANRYAIWEMRLDAFWNPATWKTKDRLCYGAFSWFLTFQDTTMYMSPVRWTDTTVWHHIFETDIGDPIAGTFDTTNATGTGDYGTRRWVLRRKYLHDGDTAIVLFRTGYGSDPGTTSDSIHIALGNNYHYIDANGDTTSSPQDSVWILPMQGWIGVQLAGLEYAPTISSISPSTSKYRDSTDAISATVTDDYGVNHIYNYLWPPDSVPGVNESVSVWDSAYSTGDTAVIWYPAHNYTWADSGNYWIVFVAVDDSSHTTRDSGQILVDVQAAAPPSASLGARVRMRK